MNQISKQDSTPPGAGQPECMSKPLNEISEGAIRLLWDVESAVTDATSAAEALAEINKAGGSSAYYYLTHKIIDHVHEIDAALEAAMGAINTDGQARGCSVSAPSPDAELIRLCAEYEAAERRIKDLYAPDDVDEDKAGIVLTGINAEADLILRRMEELPAQTPAGIHAIARAVAACNSDFESNFHSKGTWPCRLLVCLMRNAAALGVAA